MQFVLSFDRFGHFTDYKAGLRYCASRHQAWEAALSRPDFRSPGNPHQDTARALYAFTSWFADGWRHSRGVADAGPQSARNVTAELMQAWLLAE
jgi:hypothetical protein